MMRKLSLLFFFIACALYASAQVLVSTDPQLRNAVLEEFTGIHCQYCPDGHAIAQSIADANPGRVVLINIHQGSFAVPSAGEPDYRTAFGDALATQGGINAYPMGTVNRHLFPGNTTTGMSRSAWGAAAASTLNMNSPVNVGIQSEYEASTRTLTISVEVYYTGSSAAAVNYLNVVLLQDSLYGPQTGGNMGNNYHHKHMLRHMITGQWGDTINNTGQGRLVTRTYTYVVPISYTNIPCIVEDCHVAVFVAESHQEVYSGDVVYAVGGTNKYVGSLAGPSPAIVAGNNGIATTMTFTATSALDVPEPFLFSLETLGLPADWSADLSVDGVIYTMPATVILTPGTPQTIEVIVTPGVTPGIAAFTIIMKSLGYPAAPARQATAHMIANVTDLVLNGSGGSETWLYQHHYLNGLLFAGNTHFTSASISLVAEGVAGGAFAGVNNLYLNIGWTFPALKDDEATAIMQFMDNGGNVMIGGQDIGWDIMSGDAGSNGNAITQNFYTNYLHAGYLGDGTSANNQLSVVSSDLVFGNLGNSAVVCPYGTNNYPEEISPLANAFAIYKYNNGTKTAAIRAQTAAYKSVYFGVGMEMVGDTNLRNAIVKRTHDWFYSLVAEQEVVAGDPGIKVFPNPCADQLAITTGRQVNQLNIRILDISGRLVLETRTGGTASPAAIETASLDNGVYLMQVIGDGVLLGVQRIEVLR